MCGDAPRARSHGKVGKTIRSVLDPVGEDIRQILERGSGPHQLIVMARMTEESRRLEPPLVGNRLDQIVAFKRRGQRNLLRHPVAYPVRRGGSEFVDGTVVGRIDPEIGAGAGIFGQFQRSLPAHESRRMVEVEIDGHRRTGPRREFDSPQTRRVLITRIGRRDHAIGQGLGLTPRQIVVAMGRRPHVPGSSRCRRGDRRPRVIRPFDRDVPRDENARAVRNCRQNHLGRNRRRGLEPHVSRKGCEGERQRIRCRVLLLPHQRDRTA